MKLRIKKGDTVTVIAGNDKGTSGRVISIDKEKMRLVVEGVNVRKKHSRPTQANPNGGIISMEMPIHYSNVLLSDKNGKGTRISIERSKVNGKSVVKRLAKTTGEEL
ncbi:MAG: 50S ribosomal protein L24 [Candidatus Kapabacteria bacterium]|nr:50S ribosomal protein L24 [Candidatus Kapabacteria bacterium]MBX7153795.1 50S ribosomal protein L24 [Bacteroidota bacterium]